MLAVLAAFFCLLFFAAAKKSRCRPAQGRRLKHANKSRMPAQSHNADASAKAKSPGQRMNSEGKSRMPAQKPKHQTATPEAREAKSGCRRKANRTTERRRQKTKPTATSHRTTASRDIDKRYA